MKSLPVWKRAVFILWLLLWPVVIAAHWYPIRFASLRAGLALSVMLLLGGALVLGWSRKPVRVVGALGAAALSALALLPGREVDTSDLRREYVGALSSYTGTRYVWGGESRRGIDCSGLMRCALIDVLWRHGLRTLNPAPVREALSLWWNDSSARAMKEGHRKRTRVLFESPSINGLGARRVEPGDMAVTSNGVHVLAYVGNQTWIEADPNLLHGNSVILVKVPTRNTWFDMPVHIVRWRQLD